MKNRFLFFSIIILLSAKQYAQTTNENNWAQNLKAEPNQIHWNMFEHHPMHAIFDSAILYTDAFKAIIEAEGSNVFYKDEVSYLLKLTPFSKYNIPYKNAKNEFERRSVEKQVLDEYRTVKNILHDKRFVKIGMIMNLSEYSFTAKGFSIVKKSLDNFNKSLTNHNIIIDPDFAPVPNTIDMPENVAEQFVNENPNREVLMWGIVDLWDSPKQLKFIAFTYVKPKTGESVFAVYPNSKTISFHILDWSIDPTETSVKEVIDNDMQYLAVNRTYFNTMDSVVSNIPVIRLTKLVSKCKEFGLENGLSEDAKLVILKNEKEIQKRKMALKSLLAVGRQYNGFQTVRSVKEKVIIRFDKKDDYYIWGTCTYSNGKKAKVQAWLNENDFLGIRMEFYSPTDDEIGAGNGTVFLLDNNQLVGYQMSSAINYDLNVKTNIIIK